MKILPIAEDRQFLQKTISDLREEVDQLKMLQDISRQLLSNYDFDQILAIFLDIVQELINCNFCILYLFRQDVNSFQVTAYRGVSDKDLASFKPDNEIVRWVLQEGRWTHISLPTHSENEARNFFSILPLQGATRNLGFLLIASDAATTFSPNRI